MRAAIGAHHVVAVDMDICMDNAWRAECTRPMEFPIHVRMDMIFTWTDVPTMSISFPSCEPGAAFN